MPISFYPKPGMVLICDFSNGFQPPEMTKKRRVIIVSPHRLNSQLAIVVPVSTTAPYVESTHHIRFEAGAYPFFVNDKPCWAKCDHVHSMALTRLDRLKFDGAYRSPSLSAHDLHRVRHGILSAVGLTEL